MPEIVLKAFNTWAFKREQPDNPDLLLRCIRSACAALAPITFVLYWGRGPRTLAAGSERECLVFLEKLGEGIRRCYAPGTLVRLIFTDTHAALNGFDARETKAYFQSVGEEVRLRRGFDIVYLSEIIRRLEGSVQVRPIFANDRLLSALNASAGRWYHGPGGQGSGSLRYLAQNALEKAVVAREFPHAIFLTFNSSLYRPLLPDAMPIFYAYSLRKGCSVKPWFQAS